MSRPVLARHGSGFGSAPVSSQASRDERCAACGDPFAPGALVVERPAGRNRNRLERVCAACPRLSDSCLDDGVRSRRICEGCGRPIAALRPRRHVFCSARCRWSTANAGRAAARAARRRRPCATCAALFTPRRADGHFCTAACRQRAHRARHADARSQEARP